jgi:hypothetical protein
VRGRVVADHPRRLAAFLTPETAENWRFVCEGGIADDPRLPSKSRAKRGRESPSQRTSGDHVPGPSQSDRGRTDVDWAAACVDERVVLHVRLVADVDVLATPGRLQICERRDVVEVAESDLLAVLRPRVESTNVGVRSAATASGHSADHGYDGGISSDPRSTVASWSW